MKYIIEIETNNDNKSRNANILYLCVELIKNIRGVSNVFVKLDPEITRKKRSWKSDLSYVAYNIAKSQGHKLTLVTFFDFETNVEKARVRKSFNMFVNAIRYSFNVTLLEAQEMANEALLK